MEQNIQQCKECIKKIKKALDESGYNCIKTGDNILCKTPRRSTITTVNKVPLLMDKSSSAATCICPLNAAGTIDKNNNCTCSGVCNVPQSSCPVCSGSSNGTGNTYYGSADHLYRIMPTDIYNGIFLHVILLQGEHVDLKMTFGYDKDAIQELINTINFLVG